MLIGNTILLGTGSLPTKFTLLQGYAPKRAQEPVAPTPLACP